MSFSTRNQAGFLRAARHFCGSVLPQQLTRDGEVDMHSYAVEVAGEPVNDRQAAWMLWSDDSKRFLMVSNGVPVVNGKTTGIQFCSMQDALRFKPDIPETLIPVQVVTDGFHISADVCTAIRSLNIDGVATIDYPIFLTQIDGDVATWSKQSENTTLLFGSKQSAMDVRGMLRDMRHMVVDVPGLVEINRVVDTAISVRSSKCYFRRAVIPTCTTYCDNIRAVRIRR